ncbi:MAG: amidohydrolase [Geobacillus sp.]|uniref:amidohydrolase n=1 Tax=Parageobacillus thermoglucosidasius TaxID=1426 RepID=UPI000E36B85B|nr:amidohydrolase [Parageobacillus thermoglucosidasius]REK59564.1 MAG: amidohydrolase [Geobacillus sp.]GCD82886.1 amidohydrolase [Parageobacillus thermoglucosidasius]
MIVIHGGTLLVGNGEKIENACIVVENGKIKEVEHQVQKHPFCHGAHIIDATGKFITPGLIDVHTHLGVHEEGIGKEGHDFNEISSPATPHVRAIDGINPKDKGFDDARRAGVTTVQVMPGSANVIGGEMVVIKTAGQTVDEMVVRNPSGMKAAFGENPKRFYGDKGKLPTTRMGIAALFREQFIQAQTYLQKVENGKEVDRDLKMENLAKVLKKEMPLRVHAHRADDIMTVIRLAKEFGFTYTIEHCTEGHHVARYLAENGIQVSVGPTMSTRSKVELADKGWHTLLALRDAGVPFSITTDHPVVGIEHLMTSAILAVKHGLEESIALQAITLNAAKHLGIEDRVGSVEVGKDADIVIWSGDPFDLRQNVEMTMINGRIVFQRD